MYKEKVVRNLNELQHHVKNDLMQKGLLPGTRDYTKFIIICSIRTGSTMLCSLLNSHPSVQAYFELFHRHLESVPFGLPGYRWVSKDQRVVSLHNEDPVGFLKKYIYNRKQKRVKAVGFKLLYTQARTTDPWWNGVEFNRWWEKVGRAPLLPNSKSDLWKHIADDKSYRIIHLKRRNYLKRIVSGETAIKTGNWGTGATGGVGSKRSIKISLNASELLQDFEAFRRMEDESDRLFQGHQKLEIFYEDMVTAPSIASTRIEEFLGVEARKLTAKTEKQSNKKESEVIENFESLKMAFQNTQWEHFFAE